MLHTNVKACLNGEAGTEAPVANDLIRVDGPTEVAQGTGRAQRHAERGRARAAPTWRPEHRVSSAKRRTSRACLPAQRSVARRVVSMPRRTGIEAGRASRAWARGARLR